MHDFEWPPRRESPWEREADDVATDVALDGARPEPEAMARAARTLAMGTPGTGSDQPVRDAVSARTGVDLSQVRVVPDSAEATAARSVAFAQQGEVHLAPGAWQPQEPLGRALLAHEFTHAAQLSGHAVAAHERAHQALPPARADRGLRLHFCDGPTTTTTTTTTTAAPAPAPAPAPSVTGTTVRTGIDAKVAEYDEYVAIQQALAELKKGKAAEFHEKLTRPKLEALCTKTLKLSKKDTATQLAAFDALLAHAKKKTWDAAAASALLTAIQPTVVKQLGNAGMTPAQQNQNINWLQNTPKQVLQVVLDAATTKIPPALLYATAVNEGLVDVYVRSLQAPGAGTRLTAAELAAVKTTVGVSGYQALGLDWYFSEKTEKNKPLSGYLPSGFDATKVTEEVNVNEKSQTVRSAHVGDLKTGLQVQAAILSRRMDLFLEAAKAAGYATPTDEERLFFAYVFYNPGPKEGRRTLEAHKPGGKDVRALSEWISKNEYANAQKVLRTYRFVVASGLLKGF